MVITSEAYIAIAVVAFAAVALFAVYIMKKKPKKQLSRLTAIGMLLVVAGIALGDNRFTGYGLMGAGVLLAVADMVKNFKMKRTR